MPQAWGDIIITMGNPLMEVIGHKLVHWYDWYLGTHYDVDSKRGMHEEEDYYLTDAEIIQRLGQAGFQAITKKYFLTQLGLNHLFIGWKR